MPPKFICLLKEAVTYRIKAMQQLLDNSNTSEEALAKIDYGNDQMVLAMVGDELDNPNNLVQATFYQLSTNQSNTELTLQEFGQSIADDDQIVMVFSSTSWNEAAQIKHQYLGFEPYKPMPENIVAIQSHHYKDQHGIEYGNSIEHEITATIYQPQQFGSIWQCDYQLSGYGEDHYKTVRSSDSFEVVDLAIAAAKTDLKKFEINNPNLIRV